MSTNYQVSISISPDDVNALLDAGYFLYGFKAVQGPPSGAPLVWFRTNDLSESTVVQWTESYRAYTSQNQIGPNLRITASSDVAINLGQVFSVTGAGGTGPVVQGTVPQAIGIYNQTTRDFTCGLSQQNPEGTYTPMCAFKLLSGMEDLIVPIEKVLFMFATEEVNTGTVLEQSYSNCALVDLSANSEMSVTFRLHQPGQWVQAPGVTVEGPDVDLVPLLISPSAATV